MGVCGRIADLGFAAPDLSSRCGGRVGEGVEILSPRDFILRQEGGPRFDDFDLGLARPSIARGACPVMGQESAPFRRGVDDQPENAMCLKGRASKP